MIRLEKRAPQKKMLHYSSDDHSCVVILGISPQKSCGNRMCSHYIEKKTCHVRMSWRSLGLAGPTVFFSHITADRMRGGGRRPNYVSGPLIHKRQSKKPLLYGQLPPLRCTRKGGLWLSLHYDVQASAAIYLFLSGERNIYAMQNSGKRKQFLGAFRITTAAFLISETKPT